jgi:hypothetical protein
LLHNCYERSLNISIAATKKVRRLPSRSKAPVPGIQSNDYQAILRLDDNQETIRPRTDQMQVSPAAIECVIRAEPDKDFLRLEAVVRSHTPVSGQYSFVIAKQSSTGSSNNTQSGSFALQNEPEKILTTLILDRSAIGHYRAELSLQFDHGRFTCTSP